jgi:hypothetical protein
MILSDVSLFVKIIFNFSCQPAKVVLRWRDGSILLFTRKECQELWPP